MKEVSYEAFCDTKCLLLWAKKLLRDHRQELGGGMYAHSDRLEWVDSMSQRGQAVPWLGRT